MNRYHYTVEEFLINSLLVRDLYRLVWGGGDFWGGGMVFRENGGGSVVASIVKRGIIENK